jgi:hypothetical protein
MEKTGGLAIERKSQIAFQLTLAERNLQQATISEQISPTVRKRENFHPMIWIRNQKSQFSLIFDCIDK